MAATRLLHPWDFPGKSTGVGCYCLLRVTVWSMEFSRPENWSGLPFPSPGDLPNPGTEPRFPTLQADSLPAEPPAKPKNIGVGSLSLLQQIFPTQESNWGLLHCRQILYQLSYREAPNTCKYNINVMHSCQYMENPCFSFWNAFPIFLTYSWLNTQMQSLQIWKANIIEK